MVVVFPDEIKEMSEVISQWWEKVTLNGPVFKDGTPKEIYDLYDEYKKKLEQFGGD